MLGKKFVTLILILSICLTGISLAGRSAAAADLSMGSRGPEVVQIQQSLNNKGYWSGGADGIFGPLTLQAVMSLQRSLGLTANGIVDARIKQVLAAQTGNVPVSRSGSTDIRKYPKLSKANGPYGQFRYRELAGGRIEVDPVWVRNNIVTIKLPGLNRNVQVHRLAADNFVKAFTYIKNGTATINGRRVPLLSLIRTMDGTYVTRHANWNPAAGLSNHSWGTAMDINASNHLRYVNPAREPNDPNVILWEKAFKPAGFSWGNRYSDSMHYELLK